MLTGLEELDVSHNQLRHLPPELRLLTHIHTLNLSHNQLTHLPPTMGMASLVLGNLVHMKTLDVSDNKLVFLPLDLAKCSSLTALHVAGNQLQHPAMQRAHLPCLATLQVLIEEVSGINYVNAMDQKARTHGNPLCSVALGGGKSGCVEQLQHTACKVETDNPFFKQGFTLVVRDYSKDVEVRLLTKPSTPQRTVDQAAVNTPIGGLNIQMPALFPLLYDKPFFNFFSHESVSKCARAASVLHVQAHENIVCMGDKVGAVLIVLFGCLSLSYTQVDGRECLVRHLLPGQAVGELALLCGDVSTVSATAVVPSLVVKVAGPSVSALLRNEAGKAVECLLFHLAIQYNSTHLDRLDQKDLVWGSKQWDGVRRAENLAVQERAAQMCHLHVFSHDETGTVKTAIERLAARMNDAGNPVYAATAEAAGVSREFTIEFVAPGSADRMMADSEGPALVSIVAPPRLKVTMELHCSDKVTPYMLAFREMRENVEADPYALSMLKRYAAVTSEHSVRSTPHGFIFDVEGDTLRQDAELARVDAYLSDLHKHKRVNRGLPVWEKMPLMFFVDGIFDREWDRAAERRGEYSSGNFREMASLVESIKSDDTVAELKARTPHRNQRLWRHVEKWREWHYVRQSVPEEGAAFQFFKEGPPRKTAALHIHPLHNWKTLTGLMLVKPQALLDKEKQTLVLSFQDKQLASVQALQQHAGLKTQVKAHKVELSRILAAMQTERGEIKKKFQVLKDGWNGEAVAAIKRARKQIDVLEQDFESVSQTKDRLKALYKLRGNSSDALKWKGSLALDAVWLALSRHTDAREDDVAAYSNAHGGAVEFDLINSINVADITHPLDLLETPHILKWVQSDKELSKRPAHVRAISIALEKQQINGRMLMHLEKVDLMRMGLQGPVARLLLVRIESFKQDHSLGTFNAAIEKQHALSAELAMIQTPTEQHAFLKAQFNLEDRQVLVYSNTFQKFDFLKRSEIAMVDITAAVATATGNKLHPQILKTLQKKFDPDNSGTIDLVCFCQINKSALMAGGTS